MRVYYEFLVKCLREGVQCARQPGRGQDGRQSREGAQKQDATVAMYGYGYGRPGVVMRSERPEEQ